MSQTREAKKKAIVNASAFVTLYPKLTRLANAIASFEGAYTISSRAWRNHNPGNLRWSIFSDSQKDEFAVFDNYWEGYFALLFDLWSKCSGNTTTDLGPESTISELLHVYAPPSDNNPTEAYITFVTNHTGFPKETKLRTFLNALENEC